MVKQAFIIGAIILVILALVVVYTPVGQFVGIPQITIGQKFEPIGSSCEVKADCETFIGNQGLSSEDISNLNFRCRANICEAQTITASKQRPRR